MCQANRFLDTLICDDDLYGCISEVPESLLDEGNWTTLFLAALLSLYANKPEQALEYAEEVLCMHHCQEALYIKSRALARLERYAEADEVNGVMGDEIDLSTPDAKILYMIAMLNELYIGYPGLGLMRRLVEAKPKYDRGILSMRMLMKRHNILLESPNESELVEAFNSDIEDVEFASKLKENRENAPKSVAHLIQRIKKQEFNET